MVAIRPGDVATMTGRDPCERLAMAIIGLAVRDYRKGNGHSQDAGEFLHGAWCRLLWEGLDWPLSPLHIVGAGQADNGV